MPMIALKSVPAHRSSRSTAEACIATRFSSQLSVKARRRRLAVCAAQLNSKEKRAVKEDMRMALRDKKREYDFWEEQFASLPPDVREGFVRLWEWRTTNEGIKQVDLINKEQEIAKSAGSTNSFDSDTPREKVLSHLMKHTMENPFPVKYETILDAARYDRRNMVLEFLEAGDDPNRVDNENRSALHLAAIHGGAVVIEVLVDAGADVHAKDSNGDTPLHIAVGAGSALAAVVLLVAGADGAVQNKRGQTPADIVRQNPENSILKDKNLLALLDYLASS